MHPNLKGGSTWEQVIYGSDVVIKFIFNFVKEYSCQLTLPNKCLHKVPLTLNTTSLTLNTTSKMVVDGNEIHEKKRYSRIDKYNPGHCDAALISNLPTNSLLLPPIMSAYRTCSEFHYIEDQQAL